MGQSLSFTNAGATPVKNPLTWGPLGAVAGAVKSIGSALTPPKTPTPVSGGAKSVGVLAPQSTALKGLMPDYSKPNIMGSLKNVASNQPIGTGQVAQTPPAQTGTNPGMINQPVKSVTGVDGSKTEYHAPAETTPPVYDPKTGFVTDYGKSVGTKAVQPGDPLAPQTTATPTPITTPTPTVTPATDTTNISNPALLERLSSAGIGGQESPQVAKARQDLLDAQKQFAQQTSNINQSGTWTGRALGEQGQANIQNASVLNALQGTLGSALTSQGQQIGATQAALGATAPLEQFGMKINPQTGQLIGGEGTMARQVIEGGLAKALQLYNSGTVTMDQAIQTSGLGMLGSAANALMSSAIMSQGGANPVTQSAAATQNVGQGLAAGGQAYALDTGLKQLTTLTPIVNTIMSKANINPTTSPLYNEQIGKYQANLGQPGAMNQLNIVMGELRKFQSQLLSSGAGGIPTDVSNTINSTDISKLSLKDINTALETMDILGKNQQAVLQGQSTSSMGKTSLYTGTPQQVTSNVPVATPGAGVGAGITSPLGQFAAGSALGLVPTAVSGVAQGATQGAGMAVGSKLLKWIAPMAL